MTAGTRESPSREEKLRNGRTRREKRRAALLLLRETERDSSTFESSLQSGPSGDRVTISVNRVHIVHHYTSVETN